MSDTVSFRCPICRSQVYERVGLATDRRPVFECAGCSVLFRDPTRLTRFEPHTAGILAPELSQHWRKL
ncbi:MAG: hypothetical protein R3E77_06930 [Steroidobacteraceae bacterium]